MLRESNCIKLWLIAISNGAAYSGIKEVCSKVLSMLLIIIIIMVMRIVNSYRYCVHINFWTESHSKSKIMGEGRECSVDVRVLANSGEVLPKY